MRPPKYREQPIAKKAVICRHAFTVVALFAANSAWAESYQKPWESTPPPNVIEDRLALEVTFWNSNINTTIRADTTPTQPGTTLDGESDLGLKSKVLMPNFELTMHPGKRHLLRLTGFSSRRSGETTLKNTVIFDGDTYKPGDVINSELNINSIGLTYGYRVIKTPRYDLTADLSLQILQFETNVTGPATSNRPADSIVLPEPMAGLEGRAEVYNKWSITGRYHWLGATVNTTHGVVRDWRLGVLWQCNQHLGIGLDYRTLTMNVDVTSGSHPGIVDLRYGGIQLGFRASL